MKKQEIYSVEHIRDKKSGKIHLLVKDLSTDKDDILDFDYTRENVEQVMTDYFNKKGLEVINFTRYRLGAYHFVVEDKGIE